MSGKTTHIFFFNFFSKIAEFERKKLEKSKIIQKPKTHWTYFMQILSNYNTKSLYHIENSVIKALKSDIFHSYTCEINIGDIWLQFEKLKKLRQMALSYRNIKNKC